MTLRDYLSEKITAARDELDELEYQRDRLDLQPIRIGPHVPPPRLSRDELLEVHRRAWKACRGLRDGHREALQAQIHRRAGRIQPD